MIYLGKTSVGIATITQGEGTDMSKLIIVPYNTSYQPYVTYGRFAYVSQKYTCYVL